MSVRTLRYYDTLGLFSPSQRTEAGYRLYSDEDLVRLQQILALKFLGFSLEEIKVCLQAAPKGLQEALAAQRSMALEWRTRLDRVIAALAEAERLLQTTSGDGESLVHVIRAIQMEQDRDWAKKYFSEEQRRTMQELLEQSYSESARQRLSEMHGERVWTEEDQKRVDAHYAALYAGVRRLVAAGADPASAEAQALAGDALQLSYEFTGGDPTIAAAVQQWRKHHDALPAAQQPLQRPLTKEEATFLDRAKELARPGWQPAGA